MTFHRHSSRLYSTLFSKHRPILKLPIIASVWYTVAKKENSDTWTLNYGASCIPKTMNSISNHKKHIAALDCCGEDSFVIAENDFQVVIGIADGVGSWRSKGIDPSKFPRSLMLNLKDSITGKSEDSGLLATLSGGSKNENPVELISTSSLLKNAFWRLIRGYFKGKERPFGSSTISIVSLDKQSGTLETCNLGDSGFIIVRDDQILTRSASQQHRFNAPYQLMLTPEGDVSDCSHMAAISSYELRSGDLIIVASDGLWDNLYEQDILSILKQNKAFLGNPKEMAEIIVRQARIASEREDYESPFCVEARRHGLSRLGGKVDDITVIVGVAKSTNET